MLDNLDAVLRAGADQIAEAARPPAAGLVRARGDKQRRQAIAGTAVLVLIALTGVLAVLPVAAGLGRSTQAAGPRNPLRLVAPRTYIEGIPNPVRFHIPGSGVAATVTVEVDLGRPGYAGYRQPALLRRAAGSWQPVTVESRHGNWTGRYSVRVPAAGRAQHLLVVPEVPREAPPWGAGRVLVRVLAGRRLIAAQHGPYASLSTVTGAWAHTGAAPISVPRATSGELSFTLRNPVSIGYQVQLFLHASLCPAPTCTSKPHGIEVQWLHAGTWQDLTLSAWATPGNGERLETVRLAPRATLTIRFKLIMSVDGPSTTGQFVMEVQPDRASFPGPSRLYAPTSSSVDTAIITTG
jgi:hypothetical protein